LWIITVIKVNLFFENKEEKWKEKVIQNVLKMKINSRKNEEINRESMIVNLFGKYHRRNNK